MRFFTTEGPVNCADHYCLPPLTRFDLEEVLALIAQKKYFLLHAPRQTGKTTCLLALAEYLNRQGDYHAVYANIEAAQALREDVAQAMATAVTYIATSAAGLTGDSIAVPLVQRSAGETSASGALGVFLTRWCAVGQAAGAAAGRGRCAGRRHADLAAAPVARRLPDATARLSAEPDPVRRA
jgi:hypothetical protein